MSTVTLPVCLAVLAVSACATAHAHPTSWDTNQDGFMDEDEFRTCMDETGLFGAWDADHGGYLDAAEFHDGLNAFGVHFDPADGYEAWDRDGDGRLEPEEFYAGSFKEVDVDSDGLIDGFEFSVIGRAIGLNGRLGYAQAASH